MASIEDPGPSQTISGRTIDMRLEEHFYRRRFCATIIGPVEVVNEPYFSGMHLLKLDGSAVEKLSVDHLLFLPRSYRFHRGILFRRGRVPNRGEPYRASLEKFLFSRNLAIRALSGEVYTSTHLKELMETMSFKSKYEFTMLAYGVIPSLKV